LIPVTQELGPKQIILSHQLISEAQEGRKSVSARILNSGTPTLDREDGDWISSLTDGGTGDVTIIFVAGIFSIAPNCTANPEVRTKTTSIQNSSTASVRVYTDSALTGVGEDMAFTISCIGGK
jgi:hypothetical protein